MDARAADFSWADLRRFDGQGANFEALGQSEVAEMVSEGVSAAPHQNIFGAKFDYQTQGPKLTRLECVNAIESSWAGANFRAADLAHADFSYSTFGTAKLDFPFPHRSIRKILWAYMKGDKRTRLKYSMSSSYLLLRAPAIFLGASFRDTQLEGCRGPDLIITTEQLTECRSPIDASELAKPRGGSSASDDQPGESSTKLGRN
jgi:uncharacterized protein YjbI with pentapeptide repeats